MRGSTDDIIDMMVVCREQLAAEGINTSPSTELLLAMADLAFRVKWRQEDQDDKLAAIEKEGLDQ